jgi:muconolactone delta-isomerase
MLAGDTEAVEYLVTMTSHVPEGTTAAEIADASAREAERARELAARGHLVRLWQLPADKGVSSALGLWQAGDAAEMRAIIEALPLYPYLTTEITPLTPHPSDPAAPGSRTPPTT